MSSISICSRCKTKKIHDTYKFCEICRMKARCQQQKFRDDNTERNRETQKKYYNSHRDDILYRKYYSSLDKIIKTRIRYLLTRDKQAEREINIDQYITLEIIKDMINKSGCACTYCGCDLKLSDYEKRDKEQFSIDRKDDSLAHHIDNVQITCLGCNLLKQVTKVRCTHHK